MGREQVVGRGLDPVGGCRWLPFPALAKPATQTPVGRLLLVRGQRARMAGRPWGT
jgi:hypothetical protein